MEYSAPYSSWYGYFDITPDWSPIIGYDNKIENLIHMVGLSAHGFKFAPAYGDIISDLIIYGRSTKYDISSLTIERFIKGERQRGKYEYGLLG